MILKMDGVGGYAGWRWVYIIEGIFSILIAFLVWYGLPNEPSTAYFLNAEERRMMQVRNARASPVHGQRGLQLGGGEDRAARPQALT